MSFRALFDFEAALADYTGAPHVVLTDGCTHALELCFRYDRIQNTSLTCYSYLSVPMMLTHLGINYTFTDKTWQGEYQFENTRIWDSARRLEPGMYRSGQFQCLSFGWTKPLQLGRVGAILLDDQEAYEKFSRQRSDGRDLRVPWETETELTAGWHYCPTLENCVQGLKLLPLIEPQCQSAIYPDLRTINILE